MEAKGRTMIVALDLGINYGYSILLKNKKVVSGNGTIKSSSKVKGILDLLNSLENFHGCKIKKIYYEKVTFGYNTYATQAHGKYVGALELFCSDRDIDCIGIEVPTVKKDLTGIGNASKMAMMHYANKYVIKDIKNDNEADAIGVLVAGLKKDGVTLRK